MYKYLALVVLLFSLNKFSYSQTEIGLEDAIKTAIKNDPTISATENTIRIQKYSIKTAKGDLFPSLTFSGGWTKSNTFSEGGTIYQNGIEIPVADQSTSNDNFFLNLNSSVTLFNGFSNYKSIDLEEQNEVSLKLQIQQQKDDIVNRVYQVFYDVLKKDRIVEINEDNLRTSTSQLNRVKEFQLVGKRTIADVYKQDVQVAQDELTLERSRNDLRKSKVDLLLVMNDNLDRTFEITGNNKDTAMTNQDLQTILLNYKNSETLVKKAVNNRYDYKKTLQDIRINNIRLDIAERNVYFPIVSATGSYNINGQQIDEITNTRVFQVGLTLSYPIFQGFKLDVQRQIAEVNIKQKEEDLLKLEQQIRANIKKGILDLETAAKQVEILERNIQSARLDKELSEEQYRVGLATILDVQTATTKLNNLLIERVNSIYNFLLSKALLDYYTGDLKY